MLVAGLILPLAAALVAACSDAASDGSAPRVTRSAPMIGPGPSDESAPAASASPRPPFVADLPLDWTTLAAQEDGAGYVLHLEATGTPGVYDGRFLRRSADGAVTGQRVITVTTASADTALVRWPDGQQTPARLTLAGAGGARTELALDPGCLSYLVDGSSQLDCRLYPTDEFAPSAEPTASALEPSAQASASITPQPVELPTQDEALGYLCSIEDPSMIDHVTGADSDPYATGVLQQVLTAAGLDPGAVDGRYSPATRRAVRTFQRNNSLAADGLVGPRTWTSLQAAVCTLPSDPAG